MSGGGGGGRALPRCKSVMKCRRCGGSSEAPEFPSPIACVQELQGGGGGGGVFHSVNPPPHLLGKQGDVCFLSQSNDHSDF